MKCYVPALRILCGGLLALVLAVHFSYATQALSTDVNLDIAAATITVRGSASPNAQVVIYKDANVRPETSVTADSTGSFAANLDQYTTGLATISVRATDTKGVQTALISRQVAVVSQQTTTVRFFLPPSIVVNPSSVVYGNSIITFSGRTVPGGDVTIKINPSTVLSSPADGNGNFSIPLLARSVAVGIYTFVVEARSGQDVSDSAYGGTFVITPPLALPPATPIPPIGTIHEIQAPMITFPTGTDYTADGPFVITGTARRGLSVTVYDDNTPLGTVTSNNEGKWQFYFSPYKPIHTLRAVACQGTRCSPASASITVRFQPDSLACQPAIKLKESQLNGKAGDKLQIKGAVSGSKSRIAIISWGDGSDQRFTTPSNGSLTVEHRYRKPGIYSGFIILSGGENSCNTSVYFAAEISGSLSTWRMILLAVGTLAVLLSALWIAAKGTLNLRLPFQRW